MPAAQSRGGFGDGGSSWKGNGLEDRFGLPGHFVKLHRELKAFEAGGFPGDAEASEEGIVAQEFLESAFADEDAAAAGKGFEAGGEVYFAAKDGVILDVGF